VIKYDFLPLNATGHFNAEITSIISEEESGMIDVSPKLKKRALC
jgi:hypothetical protein